MVEAIDTDNVSIKVEDEGRRQPWACMTAGTHSELYHRLAAFETVRSERVVCRGGLSLILDDHGEVVAGVRLG